MSLEHSQFAAAGQGRLDPGAEPRLPASMEGTGTRQRILLASLDLFAHRGYHGTSIRDIAAAAGVQSATLYGHFPSKDAILAELNAGGHRAHLEALQAAVDAAGDDPVDQLRAIVRRNVLQHAGYRLLAVVCNNELHSLSPAAAAPVLALRAKSEQLLRSVVGRGIARGAFAPIHRNATLAALGSMGIRIANWFPSPDVDLDAEALAEVYADLALRMLGITDPEARL